MQVKNNLFEEDSEVALWKSKSKTTEYMLPLNSYGTEQPCLPYYGASFVQACGGKVASQVPASPRYLPSSSLTYRVAGCLLSHEAHTKNTLCRPAPGICPFRA